jgi:hypothetical protein
MTTTTKPARRVKAKPPRFIRWLVRPAADCPAGLVGITEGAKQDEYTVRRIAADAGLAFEVKKIVPDARTLDEALSNEPYHVLLSPTNGEHSCECKGWLRWQKCRHVAGLLALPGVAEMPLS